MKGTELSSLPELSLEQVPSCPWILMVSELPWLWSVALDLGDGSLSAGVTRLVGSSWRW